jgi:CDP-diacylglycerol pyrophosphatase
MARIALIAALAARLLLADVRQCACDPAKPETMRSRECSLCNEADKQAGPAEIFFLKDNNPRKPNRWLALPRVHGVVGHSLHLLPRSLQTKLWTGAIAKGKELWGDDGWGIAYNSEVNRTQCHGHVHIGKLLQGLAQGKYVDVSGPAAILAPADGTGLWLHPVAGGKIRVHYGEGITETVLLR